jgi:prolyl-tRNA synthetase
MSARKIDQLLQNVKKEITAAVHHHCNYGTNVKKQHAMCPTGKWCKYKNGDHQYNPDTYLTAANIHHVLPLYEKLTSPDLIKRCIYGVTQNRNESIHSRLWTRCSKEGFVGLKTLKFHAAYTVLQHNTGCSVDQMILKELKLEEDAGTMAKRASDVNEGRKLKSMKSAGALPPKKSRPDSDNYAPGAF